MRIYLMCFFICFCQLANYAQDFNSFNWEVYDTTNSNLGSNFIVDILVQEDGCAFVTTADSKLYFFRDGKFLEIKLPDEPSSVWLNSLTMDDEGRLYFCARGCVLVYDMVKEHWGKIDVPLFAMYMTRNRYGVILLSAHIGDNGSIYEYHGDQFRAIGTGRRDVLGFSLAPNGDAMVGFRDGFYRFPMLSDGSYGPMTDQISPLAFYDFEYDSEGVLWATSFSDLQLHSYENSKWVRHGGGPKELLYDWNGEVKFIVHKLLVLPDDRIVISSQTTPGIGVYNGENWEGYLIPGITEFGGLSEIKRGPDGSIWCASPFHGLAIFRPGKSAD